MRKKGILLFLIVDFIDRTEFIAAGCVLKFEIRRMNGRQQEGLSLTRIRVQFTVKWKCQYLARSRINSSTNNNNNVTTRHIHR